MSRKKDVNREKILAGALGVFLEQGYKGATMRKIATACDMPLATIHYYFKKKEEIFITLALPAKKNTEAIMQKLSEPEIVDGRVSEAHIQAVARMMERNAHEHHREILLILSRSKGTLFEVRGMEIIENMERVIKAIIRRYAEYMRVSFHIMPEHEPYIRITAHMVVNLYAAVAERYEPKAWVFDIISRTIAYTYHTLWDFIPKR